MLQNTLVESLLPNAERFVQLGRLAELTPPMIHEAVLHLKDQLPPADIILALYTDNAAILFELSLSLKIPFVAAGVLDIVASDDLETPDFLQDSNLLQVHFGEETLVIARSAIAAQSRVLIFRDVLTTGTSTLALLELVAAAKATPAGVAALIEAVPLGARTVFAQQNLGVFSVVRLKKINH